MRKKPIKNMVVVITGASSGIGRAAAHAFAHKGATLVLVARQARPLEEVAQECRQRGGQALVCPADVNEEDQVHQLAERALDEYGHIDVWVNNAAVSMFGRFEETPSEEFESVIRTNLFGYVYGARAILPHFREQGSGVLINVSSVVAFAPQPFTTAYSVSKAAIRALSDSLREELLDAPDIDVCTVLPASIDTPLFQHAANYSGRTPKAMNPVYPAEYVAKAILSLARRPRREQIVGRAGKMLGIQHMLMPGTTEKIFARMVDHDHFQDKPARPSEGNLYESSNNWHSVSGGWRSGHNGYGNGRKALTGALMLAAPVAGYYLMKKHSR